MGARIVVNIYGKVLLSAGKTTGRRYLKVPESLGIEYPARDCISCTVLPDTVRRCVQPFHVSAIVKNDNPVVTKTRHRNRRHDPQWY